MSYKNSPVSIPMSVNNNNRLPFDVLSGIFEIIATKETTKDPLEKLLLICRCWNIAARSHYSIWKKIDVTIGHRHTFPSCISYATRRLALSGSSIPLDIEIRVAPQHTSLSVKGKALKKACSWEHGCCDTSSVSLAEDILKMLAGPYGEGSKRWRSLSFGITTDAFDSMAYSLDILKHPMPLLEKLQLHDVAFNGEAFPSCPTLVEVDFEDVRILSLPVFQNLRKFYLMAESFQPVDLLGLGSAIQLESIDLFLSEPREVALPPCLPSVHHFSIGGIDFPRDFSLQLPNLKKLTVAYDHPGDLHQCMAANGIPFSQIESLEIAWALPLLEDHVELQSVLWALLSRCSNVQAVEMDMISFVMLLKCMWHRRAGKEQSEATVSPWDNRVVQVQTERYNAPCSESSGSSESSNLWVRQPVLASISGSEDADTLARYASEAGAPGLDASWEHIWECIS